jgi:hypothetical protein
MKQYIAPTKEKLNLGAWFASQWKVLTLGGAQLFHIIFHE